MPRLKTPCENLYLSADGADVWFVVDGERIPGHKLILTSASPWFKTMFCGSLQEQGDVDMSETVTVAEFKEFLQFFYLLDVKLTEANIEGVLDLVKQSMVDEFFVECENFLINHMSIEKMCWGYQVAIVYEAKKLQLFCEKAISINSPAIFESDSFLNAHYDVIHRIFKLDFLLCDEKRAFEACMSWARSACRRNGQDPSLMSSLRNQLNDILYQIRFASMKVEEFGSLLHKYPDLLTKEETQEIIFIQTRVNGFKPRMFNDKPRLFQQKMDGREVLTCDRFVMYETDATENNIKIKKIESTTFSSNRPVLLSGFEYSTRFGDIKITLIEKSGDGYIMPFFESKHLVGYDSEPCSVERLVSKAKFHMPIVIEPNMKYEIRLELQHVSGVKRTVLYSKVLLDHGIVIQFHPSEGETNAARGIIHRLYFSSLDNWPTERFFRARQNDANYLKCALRRTGYNVLRFLDVFTYITSLFV